MLKRPPPVVFSFFFLCCLLSFSLEAEAEEAPASQFVMPAVLWMYSLKDFSKGCEGATKLGLRVRVVAS